VEEVGPNLQNYGSTGDIEFPFVTGAKKEKGQKSLARKKKKEVGGKGKTASKTRQKKREDNREGSLVARGGRQLADLLAEGVGGGGGGDNYISC